MQMLLVLQYWGCSAGRWLIVLCQAAAAAAAAASLLPFPATRNHAAPCACVQTYVDFMSRFTGRDKEQVRKDVGRNR